MRLGLGEALRISKEVGVGAEVVRGVRSVCDISRGFMRHCNNQQMIHFAAGLLVALDVWSSKGAEINFSRR